jgi:hypothetical protein
MFAAVSGVVGLGILAGCTTQPSGLSASDQTARYLQSARGRYVIPGPPGDPWGPYIREASNRFDIPESWIRALMRQESGGSLYRNGRLITSSAGAMGLMQVMPATYSELRARHNLGPDPFDPHDNIMAGVGYMREMYDMYGSPGFLAAYNAGPNRLDDYLANQRGLPDETRHYVASIGPALRYASPRVHSPAEQYAMNQLPLYIPPGPRYGYGSAPAVQMASAATAYRPPAFTATAVQPTYPAVQQPRAVAFAELPRSYAPAPVAQPRAVAWADTPKPAYVPPAQAYVPPPVISYAPARKYAAAAPVQPYVPPPQRTVVARNYDEEETPARRTREFAPWHQSSSSRVALAIPPLPPVQRSGGGLHLISSAMAAEVYPARRGRRAIELPVSYMRVEHFHVHGAAPVTWKLHANGPIQASPACHRTTSGKMVCGAQRL